MDKRCDTKGLVDVFGCQGVYNFTGYCDRLVTRDLNQAARTLDLERRVAYLNRVDARLAKAVPAIPLFEGRSLFAFKATVQGPVSGSTGHFTWNAENWWLAE